MLQSLKYVFLLGRPGCGKSAVFRALASRIEAEQIASSFERLDDFPILWPKYAADLERARQGQTMIHSEQYGNGGYGVTRECLDECLIELSQKVEQSWSEGKLIFIEFARSSYLRALDCFSNEVLASSVIIYIECSFDTCWERNARRAEASQEEGTDDHLVPRSVMEELFLHDDQVELERQYHGSVVTINNEQEGEALLEAQADRVLEAIRVRM